MRLHLKIQVLNAMGRTVKVAHKMLDAERATGVTGGKLECIEESVGKMEELYDECIERCLEEIKGV
jgi:UDP-N-acetylglucosamine enolpyruvyl transferase